MPICLLPSTDLQTVSQITGSTKLWSSQLILLTGASGFVAAGVLHRPLRYGYKVRGTVRGQVTADEVRKTHSHRPEWR